METLTLEVGQALKLQFKELTELSKRKAVVLANISQLQMEKAKREGIEQQKLSDEQLMYLIKVVLQKYLPATKAFALCANYFNKDERWSQKVLNYSPIAEQVDRVLERLGKDEERHLMLLLKYQLLNKKKLKNCSNLRALLNLLKQWSRLASRLDEKDLEIKQLKIELESSRSMIGRMDELLNQISKVKPREHAQQLRKLYPDMAIAKIAKIVKIVGVSRASVYKYLNHN